VRDAVPQEAEEEEKPTRRHGQGRKGEIFKQQSNVNGKRITITIIMI
jgi:hypothetical protein